MPKFTTKRAHIKWFYEGHFKNNLFFSIKNRGNEILSAHLEVTLVTSMSTVNYKTKLTKKEILMKSSIGFISNL